MTFFKCAVSGIPYTILSLSNDDLPILSSGCPADEQFYQVCGLIEWNRIDVTNEMFLCGGLTCRQYDKTVNKKVPRVQLLSELDRSTLCYHGDGFERACQSKAVETLCSEDDEEWIQMPSGRYIEQSYLCDDKCDDRHDGTRDDRHVDRRDDRHAE